MSKTKNVSLTKVKSLLEEGYVLRLPKLGLPQTCDISRPDNEEVPYATPSSTWRVLTQAMTKNLDWARKYQKVILCEPSFTGACTCIVALTNKPALAYAVTSDIA